MSKIVIIGAGIGGLIAAAELGKAGYEVSLYEKEKEDLLSYDWHDDVAPQIFKDLDLPLPDKEHYHPKSDWSFVIPKAKNILFVPIKGERDLSIHRRALSKYLVDKAKQYCSMFFDVKVDSLLIKDDKVQGVKVKGKNIKADLVIDSSGALSAFRASLPESSNIQQKPYPGDIFYAFRGFYERKDAKIEHKCKAYLKHLGEQGLSWSRHEIEGEVDILVGRIDKLDKKTLDNALNELKKDNPSMGDKLLHGGQICTIPVRYPLTKMVTDGYAAIGDAAFMTIPMLGSGIASSMFAGRLIAETIIKGGVEKQNLWNYQVRFMYKAGSRHMGVDALKRWLLRTPSEDLAFLFDKGIISQKEMEVSSSGGAVKLSFIDIFKKLVAGFPRIGLLLNLKKAVDRMQKAIVLGNDIPVEYDDKKIAVWQQKLWEFFHNQH
ncbi:MAG: NAD(P)/FAD-dependent oxidoreductase [Bacillota bacterium]|jgi:digeranylgeranylglycerophospholipid reductase|nr:NAD(P)/FAD-dependent oxidoreductase [Bacillota bacterium]HHU43367.1 NAD(P)/FAD-dependent oxidoreductase [Clostridiales bacterium]